MKNLIFYTDTLINREIAFILNIPYVYINKLTKKEIKNRMVFIQNNKDAKKLKEKGLKQGKDFITFKDLYKYFDQFNREYELVNRKERKFKHSLKEIDKINPEELSLSEMLVKVLYSNPRDIDCKIIEEQANIDFNGDLWACCPTWVCKPFGNIILDEDMYNNYYARMIKLSALNKSYCFCNLNMCKYYDRKHLKDFEPKFEIREYPQQLTISTDKTCNLRCNSCRTCFYKPSEEEKNTTQLITKKLIESGWLNECCIFIAGQGEVFFSKEYIEMLKSAINGKTVKILSNGILFTEDKWNIIEKRFKEIYVAISIDAATKETYKKLRHGNFDVLLKNLQMLSQRRKENKIWSFQFNYVVQKDNYKEMIDFVKLAKKFNVDIVQFTKLNDWLTTTQEEYRENCLIIDDYLNYDLYKVFQDPIFQDPIVNIDSFDELIENSKKHYLN